MKKKLEPYLYLLPAMTGIVIFTLYPIVNVFIMSFKQDYNFLTGAYDGLGLANYQEIVTDPEFIQALRNTFGYVLLVVPISTALAIVIANLLNQNIRLKPLFQTAYFLPMVTSVTAVGMAWKLMFNYKSGIINYVLSWFGVYPINWLQDPTMNFWALVIYGIWNILPFSIIILLSGLQSIDPLYYTAARVDGASSLRIFRRITVPLLGPTIGLLMIMNTISTFKVYNELFPLFMGPGVAFNLFTVVYYIYYQFSVTTPPKYGLAAAASVVMFFIVLVFTRIELHLQRKGKVLVHEKQA